MQPPVTTELQRHLHDERVASLRSSMHRTSSFAPRHTLGAWMVSIGFRLAPDERSRNSGAGLRAGAESSEAPPCAPHSARASLHIVS